MTDASFMLPAGRSVLTVAGLDRAEFLQGLISNDTAKISSSRAIYAAFLTPQGKYLYDFCIAATSDDATGSYFLDVEAARRGDLLKRLSMYRLRSKVTLADADADWSVAVIYGADALAVLALQAEPGAAKTLGAGIVFTDPRLPDLGARAFLPKAQAESLLRDVGLTLGDAASYDRLRLSLGVPESDRDLLPDKSILLESGFDELHGVDWQKGCYMGQELTARTKYRGLVRKRLLPVAISGPAPVPGTVIMAGEKEAGEMRSVAADGSIGLAMVRLEALDDLRAGKVDHITLRAAAATLEPSIPVWAKLPEIEKTSS